MLVFTCHMITFWLNVISWLGFIAALYTLILQICILHPPCGRAGSSVLAVMAVATSSLLLSKGLNLRVTSVFWTGLFGGGASVGTASPVIYSVVTASSVLGLIAEKGKWYILLSWEVEGIYVCEEINRKIKQQLKKKRQHNQRNNHKKNNQVEVGKKGGCTVKRMK